MWYAGLLSWTAPTASASLEQVESQRYALAQIRGFVREALIAGKQLQCAEEEMI